MQENPSEALGRRSGQKDGVVTRAGWGTSPRLGHPPPNHPLKLFSGHQRAPRLHEN